MYKVYCDSINNKNNFFKNLKLLINSCNIYEQYFKCSENF